MQGGAPTRTTVTTATTSKSHAKPPVLLQAGRASPTSPQKKMLFGVDKGRGITILGCMEGATMTAQELAKAANTSKATETYEVA